MKLAKECVSLVNAEENLNFQIYAKRANISVNLKKKIMGFICCIPLVNAEENLNFRIYARQANFQ